MQITVHYTGLLRAELGLGQEAFDVDDASSLHELLQAVLGRHGEPAARHLSGANGEWQRALLFAVDEEQVLDVRSHRLTPGAQVTILHPVSGG